MKTLQNDFTTPEQSKRLLELELPQDSANMILDGYIDSANRWVPDPYPRYLEHPYSVEIKNESELYTSNVLPCWSVGRLVEIGLKCSTLEQRQVRFFCNGDDDEYSLIDYVVTALESGVMTNHMDFSKLEE